MPTLFRIAKNNPAQATDFLSECLLERPPRDDSMDGIFMWLGLSAWGSDEQARKKALKWPVLGRYVAILELPDSPWIVIRRTSPNSRGHFTIWASPGRVLNCASRTIAV